MCVRRHDEFSSNGNNCVSIKQSILDKFEANGGGSESEGID